ncbi:MAG: 5-(carboxyamino)imidazole ribonucleotide mutase [Gammaproteobacteria bacterium]
MVDDNAPQVGIMMGSENDWPVMAKAAEILRDFAVGFETRVISAHRTPDLFFEYASGLEARGMRVMIGGAGGAAHLPGVLAAKTTLPVLGVPINATPLRGMDSLLAIVQMPRGIPVATFAVGEPGAANAALFAAAILAGTDPRLAEKLKEYRAQMAEKIRNTPPPELPQ